MLDLKKNAAKWQKQWEKDAVFQVEADKRKKYYIALVYPYMSGLLHLGHLFTYTPSEVLARYKRMQGYNVLVKFGFHCTGTPIVSAAQRVKEKEPKQIETLKKMGFAEKEIPKFADPEYWCSYFPQETLIDLKNMGFAIDERYTFKTTYLDPPYDAFITWQFNKLKEKGYVKKGKHPVVWCPKDGVPVGDHDRAEGEGETPQEFLLFKHKLNDGRYLVTATLRQDTVLGITNLFVHPDIMYCEVQVGKEIWIVSEKAVKALQDQEHKVKVKGKVSGKELIGKKTKEFDGSKVLVLPATFVDEQFGTGLVHSVPSDSADDLIALWDVQKDEKRCKKYGLDVKEVQKIKPIPVLDTPEHGGVAAESMLKKYKITSQNQRKELEKIKKELYKLSYYTATFNDKYAKAFSENLKGKKVEEGKEVIKKDLIKKGFAIPFYELTGNVVCRCLTPCIIKLVEDQWFMEYNDPKWKKLTHSCLDSMTLYPEQVRKQFDYVLDWLHHWACTREFGLGTKLPWDKKWVIESLSDSTIQMAYATISKYLEHPEEYGFKTDKLNDAFFDYVYLGKGTGKEVEKSTGIPQKMIETMKKDFEYWYPFDFRNSAKDLLQNHLAFCMFNHTALFPKKYWPKAFMINGRIMVNNEKMSKSKGNFFTMRELYEKYDPDTVRLAASNAGEGVDDANYDMTFLDTAKKKLTDFYAFVKEYQGKGRTKKEGIDVWFENMIHVCVAETTKNMENMLFKSAVQTAFLDLSRHVKWYVRRSNGELHKEIISLYIETQSKLLTPFAPHFCEEMWSIIGKKNYISNASWPKAKKVNPDATKGELLIEQTMGDVQQVLKLAKVDKPKKITLFVADAWKHTAFTSIAKHLKKTFEFKAIMKAIAGDAKLKKHAGDLAKVLPKIIKTRSVPKSLGQAFEYKSLCDAQTFLTKEYACKVNVVKEEDSKEPKARQAMPGKVAILVE
jgi:leucyl-tRNA synthetase